MADFSIITVCYNSVKTIERTIRSVLQQKNVSVEYIIIDGNSNDGTQSIIKKFEKKISYWISEDDYGIYDAMNKGIIHAHGDLVAFLNSDDWYEDGILEKVWHEYKKNPADVNYGNIYMTDKGRKKIRYTGPSAYGNLPYEMSLNHPAIFIRGKILEKLKFNVRYRIAADYDMILKLFYEGATFRYLDVSPIVNFSIYGVSECLKSKTAYETSLCLKYNYRKSGKIVLLGDLAKINKARIHFLQKYAAYKALKKYSYRLENILNLYKSYSVILFGAGEIGGMMIDLFRAYGIKVSKILDNDESKKNKILKNTPIMSFNEYSHRYNDLILITNYIHSDIIKEQLQHEGYVARIDFFPYEDWSYMLINSVF